MHGIPYPTTRLVEAAIVQVREMPVWGRISESCFGEHGDVGADVEE